MKLTTLISVIVLAISVLVSSCGKSPYDKAVNYIDDLAAEVTSVTNETELDRVYNKIVNLNSNELITNLTDISRHQKQVIIQKAEVLTIKTFTAKAILYVMPKNITPTPEDMSNLINLCLSKKLNVLSIPYNEVSEIVKEYYHLNQ